MKRIAITITVLFLEFYLYCAYPPHSPAENIAVISRNNIIPYETFRKGYYEAFSQAENRGHTLETFYLGTEDGSDNRKLARSIAAFGPKMLMCIGSGALEFASSYFPDIPKAYGMVISPSFASLGIPSVKALGISLEVDIQEKLKFLREFNKGIQKIGTVYDPAETGPQIREAGEAAQQLGFSFVAVPLDSPKTATTAIEDLIKTVDAYILFLDKTMLSPHILEHLFNCSFRHKVPVIGPSEKYVKMGALFSFDLETKALGASAFNYSLVCLNDGDACAGLKAVQTPYRIFINSGIAKKMDLSVSEQLLKDARIVIR